MKSFSNKVAVITGAGSGIGRALAQELSSEGALLALSDVNLKGLEETQASLSGKSKVLITQLDVSDRSAFENYTQTVINEFGHADMLFNNAGVALSQTVENCSYDDFEWIMNINFWGVVYGTKSFLPHLLTRPEAAIINISSIFGIIALPTQSQYNAAKFAVRGFTESLRQEVKDSNLYVGCVHPGGIKTNIVVNGRMHTSMVGEQSHTQQIEEFNKMARTTPTLAAQTILKGVRKDKRRILIGQDAKFMDRLQRLFPEKYTGILSSIIKFLS
ncbi:Putative short chain dehydrogenase [Oleispira antarctica RB-8]|uniref:Putative short chain dehydrogenase n=1 Tax=Oleispira antarctica RB-8 TaxID=698738 RepID=R4YTP4_OLEAN|nr:Putative short chain dehydrogenase [Oleispira antarctica RB-8]